MTLASTDEIRNIMTERLETIKVTNSAREAALKMKNANVGSLAVLHEDGRPAGIVTERDLVRKVCADEKSSSKVTVQELLSSPVITVHASTRIGEAAEIMLKNKIRHLLVVDEENRPDGIVSATDIVSYVWKRTIVMMQADMEVIAALEKEGRFYF